MNDTLRCPACHNLPEVTVENDFTVIFSCPQHGHMAMGSSLDSARINWNQYISFVKAEAA